MTEAASVPEKPDPQSGTTTIDDKMRFGPQRMAYGATKDLAIEIADAVSDHIKGKVVVIAGTQLMTDFANLEATKVTLAGLEGEYSRIAEFVASMSESARRGPDGAAKLPVRAARSDAAGMVAAAAGANPFVAAAVGVLNLLRSDVEYHGTQTSIDRLAFELHVAGALQRRGAAKVFVPDLMVQPHTSVTDSKLLETLEKVASAKRAAWLAVAPLVTRLARAEALLDHAISEKQDAATLEKLRVEVREARQDLEPFNAPLSHADQIFDALQAQWREIKQDAELSGLARMLRIEAIKKLDPVFVHCAVVDSGGHHRIRKNLLWMIFIGDGLTFTGGAVARWGLLAPDGAVELGGIVSATRTGER
jgi:hypothetical protein